jgi:dienelactone hydrolase
MTLQIHSVPTLTHGRVLVRQARAASARGVLVGFHGYMENAAIQMKRLEEIPGSAGWTLVAVQALHRFYRGRTDDVAACWMTREDREDAIADNLAYVAAALDLAPHDETMRIVYAGFSQGVPMAYRAAICGRRPSAVIAVGGDVPPELLEDTTLAFPPVLLLRGARDVEWYTPAKFDADVAALGARGTTLRTVVYDGAHEWNAAVSAAIAAFIRE